MGEEFDRGAAERTLSPGAMLGDRYKVLSVLGFGGMGVVYRALDLKLDLEIALKRLRPDRINTEKREVLRREIILSRKVTHENVCRIFDLVEIDGVEYVSMEYIRGTSLKDIEDSQGNLPLGRGLSIAKGLCRGLAAAHRIGVLHRDLKPENVIVDEEGRPRLMDFGIAIDRTHMPREKSGTVPGTPQFLAPELLRGSSPDIRSDLYALGVLLYEMFTGRVPFDDADTAVLVRKVLHDKAPEITALRPDLPKELAAVLSRAIARDPAARFASADELAAAIETYEGQFLDRVLKEVSVVRAKSVKLMVILEANKALAATFDPTEILKIILKTATEETDAERGTIFLVEHGTRDLVSQILEGGTVDPIRLPWGHGIAGACAAEARPILTVNVASDPRHESGVDSQSGFKTRSLLAAPMKTPAGEVVGVIEILNKRHGAFTREDEEFLMEVAQHAALAVSSAREHREAVEAASREAQERIARSLRPLLSPPEWPATPGFESAPLRWRTDDNHLLAFDVEPAADSLRLVLLEDSGAFEERVGDLVRALFELRAGGAAREPGKIAHELAARVESVTIARLTAGEAEMASAGAILPFAFRDGRVLPFETALEGRVTHARFPLLAGDLVLVASRGVGMLKGNKTDPVEVEAARAAKLAPQGNLTAGFTELISAWKAEGRSPGERDVVLLGARKL
jgi:putative methionine-R-sulfoxide reductase with GAF domain